MNGSERKKISVITPCYNEQDNVADVRNRVREVFVQLPEYDYEHIFIDNDSSDETVNRLKGLAGEDPKVKIIVNTRNFGHICSPYYALLNSTGDAALIMAADLQEPPELIKDFLKKWEEGYKIVVGIKTDSDESRLMFLVRKAYYFFISKFSEMEQIKNFNGFGLYDRAVLDILVRFNDPYPYLRGQINETGYKRAEIEYTQARRKKGKTKNNFYSLYDMAMLGLVNHSKVPLRLASFIGFGMGAACFVIGMVYLCYKLLYWQQFSLGLAPLVIGIFFLGSIQLFFLGIIGEYIGAIYTQVKNRPLVIEKERINF